MAIYKNYKNLKILLERPGVSQVSIGFNKDEFSIGSSPDCDIVLKETNIAENHDFRSDCS